MSLTEFCQGLVQDFNEKNGFSGRPKQLRWNSGKREKASVEMDGNFQMGSDENDLDANPGEFPQHSITLDGFWID